MNIMELRELITETIHDYERELEEINKSNRKHPFPDKVASRVAETQIRDYKEFLRFLGDME